MQNFVTESGSLFLPREMDVTQHSTEHGDPEDPRCSYEDLPTDFIHLLYSTLPLHDLVAASCTCKHWLRCSERVWEGRVRARWQHWKGPLPSSSNSSMPPRAWRDMYRQRQGRDALVFQLLQDASWPVKQEAAFSALMELGADAIDALAVTAHSSCASSMFLGVTYHAHVALHYVVGELSAVRLRQLLQEFLENEDAGQGSTPEVAAAAAAAAAETAGGAELASAVGGASEPGSSSQGRSSGSGESQEAAAAAGGGGGGAAAASPAGALRRSEVEASFEGALVLAQALHPLSDVGALRRLVRQLGQELTRRMQLAQVLPGSRQAVELLNKLMFGPPSAATTAAPASSAAAAPSNLPAASRRSSSSSAAATSSSAAAAASPAAAAACDAGGGREELRFPWWRRNDELDGPDMSGLAVPQGSTAGLGLQGNSSSYYATSNSCLDSVLASRAGLPISLALLHAAVGEAAGLTVQLVGMPGHVVTRALIRAQGSQGSAAAGLNPSGRLFSDVGEDAAGDEERGSRSPRSSSSGQAQRADEVGVGRSGGRGGVQGASSGSWIYVDVFNGGTELSDDDLRMLALRHSFPVDAMQELLQPMSVGATLRRMTLNLVNSVRMGYASYSGHLDMQKPPLHQLQLRSISVALLSLHLASAFGSSIPARDAFDMGLQLSQLIGLGHTVGPLGGVLLMKKLTDVLPPSLVGWRVKIEAGIQGEVEAKARQQQQRQERAWLHSRHPAVRHSVGDTMHFLGSRSGTIVAWQTAPNSTLRRRQAAPSVYWFTGTLGEVVEGHYGAAEQGQAPSTDERVTYKLLYEDGTIQDVDQAARTGLNNRQQLLQHQEQQQPLHTAREQACAAQCKRQLQHLQRSLFEEGFIAELEAQGQAGRKAAQQRMAGWPNRHLSHGQHFEAWLAPDDPEQRADGWFWLNASLRVEFPEG